MFYRSGWLRCVLVISVGLYSGGDSGSCLVCGIVSVSCLCLVYILVGLVIDVWCYIVYIILYIIIHIHIYYYITIITIIILYLYFSVLHYLPFPSSHPLFYHLSLMSPIQIYLQITLQSDLSSILPIRRELVFRSDCKVFDCISSTIGVYEF